MDTFLAFDAQRNDGGVLDARLREQRALDILREHVQSLRRDDHFLLAALDQQPALGIELTDVAGMKETVGIERRAFSSRRCRRSALVPVVPV